MADYTAFVKGTNVNIPKPTRKSAQRVKLQTQYQGPQVNVKKVAKVRKPLRQEPPK